MKLLRDWVWWTMPCRGVDSCHGREVGLCSAALLSSKIILGFARNNTLCDQPGNCIQKERQRNDRVFSLQIYSRLPNRKNICQEETLLEPEICLGRRTRGLGWESGGDGEMVIPTLLRFRRWNQILTVTGLGGIAFGRQLIWGLCLVCKAEWDLPHWVLPLGSQSS